jgi:hypothetical protein
MGKVGTRQFDQVSAAKMLGNVMYLNGPTLERYMWDNRGRLEKLVEFIQRTNMELTRGQLDALIFIEDELRHFDWIDDVSGEF